MKCPSCQSEVNNLHIYCHSCGMSLFNYRMTLEKEQTQPPEKVEDKVNSGKEKTVPSYPGASYRRDTQIGSTKSFQQLEGGYDDTNRPKPKNYFAWSILSFFLLGFVGLVPIYYSIQVDRNYNMQRFDQAEYYSRLTKSISIVCIIIGAIIGIITLVVIAFLFGFFSFIYAIINGL